MRRIINAVLFSLLYGLHFNGVFGDTVVPIPGEDACPTSCQALQNGSGNWTTYSSVERVSFCNETMLLDFAVYNSLGDSSKAHTIKACTAPPSPPSRQRKRDNGARSNTTLPVEVTWKGSKGSVDMTNAIAGVEGARGWLETEKSTSVLFVRRGNSAVGVWVGALIADDVQDAGLIEQFVERLSGDGATENMVIQACNQDYGADYAFGMVVATGGSSLEVVQGTVKTWTSSSCLTGMDGTAALDEISLSSTPPAEDGATSQGSLTSRATCKSIKAASGDSCSSLAKKCGVTLANFQKYNPGKSFCSSLQPTQPACCSAGTLPTPQPGKDGTCATYTVQSGDWCAKIAAANAITTANLEAWNKNTWGWLGCSNLQSGIRMCLSKGTTPMPAPVANAECGPTKPGTSKPASGVKLASLNPCPLKSCCNFWGHCGTTADFCTPAGKGVPVSKGCISNCGTDIIKSSPPAQFKKLVYFEGFNPSRKCLKMDVSQINQSKFTHVHFAFIDVKSNFQIDTAKTQYQWGRFKTLKTTMKKIVSFGGWTFSAEAPTYDVFRKGMLPENRETLAKNMADFVNNNGMDGIDIDWEYPSAPDIPGIPPGNPKDAANYLAFLKLLRTKLGTGKSMSIAAPASFWYLKPFPIAEMSKVLDYIVFMTYDLHGQWDYGSTWASPGCPKGSCLRSHVNLTETENALSMITKAGVPSSKVLVGVSSYGRSFRMSNPACTGPTCTFTGPKSGAAKGECTDTAGYIANAEINRIIQNGAPGLKRYTDNSDSDILVYGNNWVSYMSDRRKENRIAHYKGLNFGGVSDWAVDLQKFTTGGSGGSDGGSETPYSAMVPYLQGCSKEEGKHVKQAWAEAGEIAWRHWQWSPGGKWQNAMDMYLGKGTRTDYDFWGDPGPVGQNIGREYLIHFSGFLQPPINTYSYWYCHGEDIENYNPAICKNRYAVTWSDPGRLWSSHYVILCPDWWKMDETMSLEEAVHRADGDINWQMKMDNWKPIRARTVLHETYHWTPTVSQPKCVDMQYSPDKVVELAKNGTEFAKMNAESFAEAGLAIYVMDVFHHDTPPIPAEQVATVKKEGMSTLDAPPKGWVRPVSLEETTFKPDASLGAQLLSSYGTLEGQHNGACLHGSKFWSKAQCSVYCQNHDCKTVKNADGQSVFQCDCGAIRKGVCINGQYSDKRTCEGSCDGGKCAQKAGYKDVKCTGCSQTPTCKDGVYDDFDKCGANCYEGLCTESAGVDGVTCKC